MRELKYFTSICSDMNDKALNLVEFLLENGSTAIREFLRKLKLLQWGIEKHLEECTVCVLEKENNEREKIHN